LTGIPFGLLKTNLSGMKGARRRLGGASIALLAIGALTVLFTLPAFAAIGPVGTAAGFEDNDGNMVPDPSGINFDWNSFASANNATDSQPTGLNWNGTAPYRNTNFGTPATAVVFNGWQFLGLEDAAKSTTDTGFAGGVKQDDNCPSVIGSSSPNKADLKGIMLASKTVSGHTFLMLNWMRIPQNTTSSSAHVGFEFNQGSAGPCPAGSDGLVQRVAGDLLLVYDFTGGSSVPPTISLSRWVTSGSCQVGSDSPPCWGTFIVLPPGTAEANVDSGLGGLPSSTLDTITPPPPPATLSTTSTLGTSEFGEAGIDLTNAGVFSPTTCESFGIAQGISRSSGDANTAAMEDLVGPGAFHLTNCGEVKIIKHTDPRGLNQNFSYTSNLAGSQLSCTQPTATSFTLNDNGNTTTDNSANTQDCTNVPAGSYTVTEGTEPAGFTLESLTCTATSGSSGSQDATIPAQADISVIGGGVVTCTYVNRGSGAILVTKTAKNHNLGSGQFPLAGATFTVNGVSKTTDANGQACFDGLTIGTPITVTETMAPSGYAIDTASQSVTPTGAATCSSGTPTGVTFTDSPLTDLSVSANSEVLGVTNSTITCVDSTSANIGNSPQGPADPVTVTANGLKPGTYTCTVVIDP